MFFHQQKKPPLPPLPTRKPTTLLVLSFLLGILEGYLKDARFIGCAKALLKGQYVSRAPLKGPTPSLFQNNLKYNFCLNWISPRFFLAVPQCLSDLIIVETKGLNCISATFSKAPTYVFIIVFKTYLWYIRAHIQWNISPCTPSRTSVHTWRAQCNFTLSWNNVWSGKGFASFHQNATKLTRSAKCICFQFLYLYSCSLCVYSFCICVGTHFV